MNYNLRQKAVDAVRLAVKDRALAEQVVDAIYEFIIGEED